VSDVSARILARMSVSVSGSVSASWNCSLWARNGSYLPVVESESPAGDGGGHVTEGVVADGAPFAVVKDLQTTFSDDVRRIHA